MRKGIAFLLLNVSLLFCGVAAAQDYDAASIQTSCAHWASVKVDHKHHQFKGSSEDLYQTGVCIGYFEGMMDGLNDTGGWGTDGKLVFHIDRKSISSTWDVVTAFYTYVNANPLAKGKPAWKILQTVLVNNHLAGFEPMERGALASETVH